MCRLMLQRAARTSSARKRLVRFKREWGRAGLIGHPSTLTNRRFSFPRRKDPLPVEKTKGWHLSQRPTDALRILPRRERLREKPE